MLDLIPELSRKSFTATTKPARLTLWANHVRIALQMVLGMFVLFAIVKDGIHLFTMHSETDGIAQILKDIGEILAFSAALDLAYMLFTPGPDEAVDPVIVAIAAAMLILVSSAKETFTKVAAQPG